MNLTDRTTIRAFMTALSSSGAKVPKAVSDAHARATKLSAATGNLSASEGALAVAVANALEADRDPAADPEVHRVLVASQIANQGIMQAVDAIAHDRLRDVCRRHADSLATALRVPFDAAAETLDRAHDRLGSVRLDDSAAILQMGGDAAEVWAVAQSATETITTICAGWQALGVFTRLASSDNRNAVLRMTAPDYTTWTERRLDLARLTPWEAIDTGLTLQLPTFTEHRERVAMLDRTAEQLAERDAREHQHAHAVRMSA